VWHLRRRVRLPGGRPPRRIGRRAIAGGTGAVRPAIRHGRATAPDLPAELTGTPLSDGRLDAVLRRDGRVQFGTLGRGNHFLEFQSDDDGRLWLMVHSGSRAMGQAIRDLHVGRAARSACGLACLDADDAAGRAYLRTRNGPVATPRQPPGHGRDSGPRGRRTVRAVAVDGSWLDCDHNHVRRRCIRSELLVHRKGAMPAAAGEPGIIPGSMGTESYHVEGRGHEPALCSSSHGAGRAMSRDEARRRCRSRTSAGSWPASGTTPGRPLLRDEAPSAYKDVRAVLRAQRDLTRVVRRLRPVLCYKGA